MGKTQSKPLAAQHGRGTAWEWYGVCVNYALENKMMLTGAGITTVGEITTAIQTAGITTVGEITTAIQTAGITTVGEITTAG
jgi:hypothetical protein